MQVKTPMLEFTDEIPRKGVFVKPLGSETGGYFRFLFKFCFALLKEKTLLAPYTWPQSEAFGDFLTFNLED